MGDQEWQVTVVRSSAENLNVQDDYLQHDLSHKGDALTTMLPSRHLCRCSMSTPARVPREALRELERRGSVPGSDWVGEGSDGPGTWAGGTAHGWIPGNDHDVQEIFLNAARDGGELLLVPVNSVPLGFEHKLNIFNSLNTHISCHSLYSQRSFASSCFYSHLCIDFVCNLLSCLSLVEKTALDVRSEKRHFKESVHPRLFCYYWAWKTNTS